MTTGLSIELSPGRFLGKVEGDGVGDLDPNLGDRRGSDLAADVEHDLVTFSAGEWSEMDGLDEGEEESSGTSRCVGGPEVVSCDVRGVGG